MAHNLKTIRKQFQNAGVFHTDAKLAEILKDRVGKCESVYDPTCGDGALLAVFPDDVKKFGQEINPEYLKDAEQRLTNFTGAVGDTLTEPAFADMKFDAIVANPPFSISWTPKPDPRFDVAPALAPKSKADYAFILHTLSMLSENGTAAVLCFPGILYRGNAEGKIRQWMIEKGYIWKVERIPGGFFADTSIETALLTIRKQPCTSIEFVDTVENLSKTVSLDDVAKNGFNLSVSAYIKKQPERKTMTPEEEMAMNEEVERITVNNLVLKLEAQKMLEELGMPVSVSRFATRIIDAVRPYQ